MKYYLSDVPFVVKSWCYDRHENVEIEEVYLGKVNVTNELDEACMDDLRNKIAEEISYEEWKAERNAELAEELNPHFEINEDINPHFEIANETV